MMRKTTARRGRKWVRSVATPNNSQPSANIPYDTRNPAAASQSVGGGSGWLPLEELGGFGCY